MRTESPQIKSRMILRLANRPVAATMKRSWTGTSPHFTPEKRTC